MHFIEKSSEFLDGSIPDAELWSAFQKGSKKALEIIYRRYVNDLHTYGIKIRGHEGLIKDCIQELFVELWSTKERLASTDNIKYYLLKALKLKINHHLNKELRYTDADLCPVGEVHELSYESILIKEVHEKERKIIVSTLLNELPPKQREVLNLLFYQELSYKEVSEMMAINVRSVYTLAWKSLSALRKKMGMK